VRFAYSAQNLIDLLSVQGLLLQQSTGQLMKRFKVLLDRFDVFA